MSVTCPHCNEELTHTMDAFCPDCGGDLSEFKESLPASATVTAAAVPRGGKDLLTEKDLTKIRHILTDSRKIIPLQLLSFLIRILILGVTPAAMVRLVQARAAMKKHPRRDEDNGYAALCAETDRTLEAAAIRFLLVSLIWPGIILTIVVGAMLFAGAP